MVKKLLVLIAAAAAFTVMTAGPASAQFIPATLDVDFECNEADGEHVITFTLDSPDLGGTTLFDPTLTATSSPDVDLDIEDFAGDILAGETGTATITIEGSFTGNVDWQVTYQEGGEPELNEGNVELGEPCLAPTTTTQPTTTTTRPAPVVAVQPTFTG
jgi:hypothetical protein